jgi:hypothetical protein
MRADRLRVINAPQRVEVEVDANGLPTLVTFPQRVTGSVQCEVEAVGEVWRIEDEWWRQPIARRCFEVVFDGGGRSLLYQDLITEEWFVQRP